MTDLNLGSSPSLRRTALLVAALHAAVLLIACLPGLFHKPAPEFMRVQLTSPSRETPTNSAPQPQPPSTTPDSAESPPPPPPTESAPTEPSSPPPPARNTWSARSPDDIRRSAKLDPVRNSTTQSSAPAPRNDQPPDLTELRNALQRETKVSVAAEAANAPQTSWDAAPYAAAVRTHLYKRWQKPAGGDANDSARARLRIDRNGRIIEARLLDADTRAMRQSVQQLLDSLSNLPSPAEFGLANSTVTLPIVFRLKQ